jgi:hypothetical protein
MNDRVPDTRTSLIVFPKRSGDLTPSMRELELQTFTIAFETALEAVAAGQSLEAFCKEYHNPLIHTRMRTWIHADERRKQAYYKHLAIGAEALEDEMLRISDGIKEDGTASLDDVSRSTLRVNTRKWLMQVRNRTRYGDVKQIEQTHLTKFDPSSATTEQLQARLLASFGINPDTLNIFDAQDITDVRDLQMTLAPSTSPTGWMLHDIIRTSRLARWPDRL